MNSGATKSYINKKIHNLNEMAGRASGSKDLKKLSKEKVKTKSKSKPKIIIINNNHSSMYKMSSVKDSQEDPRLQSIGEKLVKLREELQKEIGSY